MTLTELRSLVQESIGELIVESPIIRKRLQNSVRKPTLLPESMNKLNRLIRESVKELKLEQKDSIIEDMDKLNTYVSGINKSYAIMPAVGRLGDYELCGCLPHHVIIHPTYMNCYDVTHIKDGSDRLKKLNLTFKLMKEFISERLNDKSGNYVEKAFNKSAKNSEDVVKKESELPETKVNSVKKISDVKNANKDYTELSVKNEADLQDKPMAEIKDIKKQSAHEINDKATKFNPPTQTKQEKNHVLKGGKGKELKLSEKKIKRK